ncbi:MAG: hypothetical protein IT210_19700 [Armatimonadetes bacterium]|nr:hypothetical protein [Armatimonadota bacterium]
MSDVRSSARPVSRRPDAWKVIGPGGGGTMLDPTLSPHNPDIVVEYCDMTGSYITNDGGQSWRMFNLRMGTGLFAFDPGSPSVIYAGNAALWRSEDTGKTWSMIWPDPRKNTVEYCRGDHGDVVLATEDPSYPRRRGWIRAITVNPADSDQIYVAFENTLYLSEDRGAVWKPIQEMSGESVRLIWVQPEGPAGEKTVYAIGRTGVHRGRGERWEHFSAPAGGRILEAAAGKKKDGSPLFYAAVPARWDGKALAGGIYISENGGESWQPSLRGLQEIIDNPGSGEPPHFGAIACAAQDAACAYVSFRGLRLGEGPENLYNGIAKTTDGGKSWAIAHRESNRASSNLEGSWVEGRAPDGWANIWFDAPVSLGVAPTDGNICYASDCFRTYRTFDGGTTWRQANSASMGDDRWATTGLDVTTCYGVHFDPFDPNRIFISYTDCGLFRSEDGGLSWTGATVGIPNRWRNTTYWIEFDPKVKGLIWGAFGHNHDLPRPKMWRDQDPARYQGGVGVSTDGGQSWALSSWGMEETAVTHVLLDPASPVGSRTLYACGFGRGVYKSTDNGKTWALKNKGIEKKQPFAWRITRADDGTLYLVVSRRSDSIHVSAEEDGALYKSTDGAESWVKMAMPEGLDAPTGLTLDPKDNRRMYLTSWGTGSPEGDIHGGVFLSTNAGQTWQQIFREPPHVYDLTVDPRNPKALYICGFDSAAFRSLDGGQTWSRIQGYNFKWGHRVVMDPANPEKIYITTFGGSVWHGPAAGDPNAAEDIATPIRQAL